MAPIEAKVFFVDDEKCHQELGRIYLEEAGHKIVGTAMTFDEAMAKIPELDKLGVNVAVVDGNLSERYGGTGDGERIALEIKKQHPNIKVVGHALYDPIVNAHINSTKIQGGVQLVETITKI